MSDLSDSGSSGLSDWALVNSQGELESSDVDSNTSSIEVVGRDTEVEEEELGQSDPVSGGLSQECIELKLLRDAAEAAAATGQQGEQKVSDASAEETDSSLPATAYDESHVAGFGTDLEQPPQEVLGACCSELLQTSERRQLTEEDRERVISAVQHPLGSDTPTSSGSLLSLSGLSSLSNTSKSSRTDSDSESDFVRLEKESSSVNTESEGEELLPGSRVNAMATSGSSVGSGFNFLSGSNAPIQPVLPMPPPLQHQEQAQEVVPPSPQILPLQPQQAWPQEVPPQPEQDGPQPERPQQEERPPSPPPLPPQEEERPVPLLQPPPPRVPIVAAAAAAVVDDADDGDTESSAEDQDQDDRIESEQSDDANSAQADDLDQVDLSVVNDIGDVPVERGGVERHYVHCNNQQLNGRLNRVVLAVLVLTLGIGLGHWIGSAREHFSQMEIQLAHIKRLHQMQDEYVQCLARNDELLLDHDITLQGERDRHQEAMADLRDNNRELQEQLQDAQDQLEQLLAAQAKASRSSQHAQKTHLGPAELPDVLGIARLLIADEAQFQASAAFWDEDTQLQLQQARQSFAQVMARRQAEGHSEWETKFQQETARGQQLNTLLQEARQHLNSVQNENAELKVNVGKMRYHVAGSSGDLPPPPNPVPPPPPAMKIDDEGAEEELEKMNSPSAEGDLEEQSVLTPGAQEEQLEEKIQGSHDNHNVRESTSAKVACSAQTPQPVPVDVTLLQRNLTRERQRAEMWHRLYLSEQAENKQPLNTSACFQYWSQQMNFSAVMHYITKWNLTRAGGEDFTNLTYLVSSIARLQNNLMQALPSWEELSSTVQQFRSDTRDSGKEEPSEDKVEEGGKEEKPAREGGGMKKKWSDGVKKLLNKTRGTLSNVSRQLQQTWGQVKDVSRRFWPSDDSLIGRMAARVQAGVNKLSKKVNKLSNKVQKKANRWFKKRSKKDRHGDRKSDETTYQEEADSRKSHKKVGKKGKAFRNTGKMNKEGSAKKQKRKENKGHWHREKDAKQTQDNEVGKEFDKQRHDSLPAKDSKDEKKSDIHHSGDPQVKDNKGKKNFDKHGRKDSKDGKKGTRLDKSQFKDSHGKHGKNDKKVDKRHHKDSHKMDGKHKGHRKKNHFKGARGKDKKEEQFGKYRHENSLGEDGKKGKKDSQDKHSRKEERKIHKNHPEEWHNKETQFQTKAKHHSSSSQKKAAKARFKLQAKFQKLFSRTGAMVKPNFNHMDREDTWEMFDDVDDIFRQYGHGSKIGLPISGHHWLKCQLFWWANVEPQHMLFEPSRDCLQYLAPWQLDVVNDFKKQTETGQCRRIKRASCIDILPEDSGDCKSRRVCQDPEPDSREDYYMYVCISDKDHEDDARYAPKGSREGDKDGTDVPVVAPPDRQFRKEKPNSSLEQVNETAEDVQAWYFVWVQGRNNMRHVEHKADWMFDRASNRDESRQEEHSADWIFERAAERHASRESEMDEQAKEEWEEDDDNDNDDDDYDDDDDWQSWAREEHGHHRKRNFSQKKRNHQGKGGDFKRHKRDFRQKYGRTSFCGFC